ncbi:MAG: hypothetical protein ACFFFC_13060 [Candidatus Thorarchaeota archaeon]
MKWRIRENRESRETSDLEQIRRRMREMIEELKAEEEAQITAQEIAKEVQKQQLEMGDKESPETPTAQELVRDESMQRNVREVEEQHNIDRIVEAALDAIETDDDFEERKGRAKENLKESGEHPLSIGELREIPAEKVKEAFGDRESGDLDKDRIVEGLKQLAGEYIEESCAFHFDLQRDLGLSQGELEEFGKAFQETRETLDNRGEVRFGLVDERLYGWKPDLDPIRLENAYDEMYYYFRNKDAFEKYIGDAGKVLGLEGQDQKETIKHLHELASQMVTEPVSEKCVNPKTKRVRGDYVQLINGLSGKTLSDLEGEISKLTGQNGHGGIENPLFPEGERLEVAIARIAATVFSDCTIEPNGVIKYGEPNLHRIARVIENVRVFGDVNPSPRYIEGEGHYITHLPFVIGKLLMYREIPSGDRTIQNPRLIRSVREGTYEVKRAYTGDFIHQDGCVGEKIIIWRRVNAMDAGEKSEIYHFEPRIGIEEKNFIKEHGRKETGNTNSWALSWGKLTELRRHENSSIASTAENLQKAVKENPNRLLHDEATIVRDMGINVSDLPSDLRYYPETGRVTVVWQAYTVGVKEAIKLGIIAFPNDSQSRQKVERMIARYPEETSEAIRDLRKRGVEFEKWWER